jgi:hypothetical protein
VATLRHGGKLVLLAVVGFGVAERPQKWDRTTGENCFVPSAKAISGIGSLRNLRECGIGRNEWQAEKRPLVQIASLTNNNGNLSESSRWSMSFRHTFNAEYRRLAPLFAAAEKADKDFHAGWKEGLKRLGASRYKQSEQYQHTLDRFNESRQVIDQVIATALSEAKTGSHAHLATLFAYLALPGRCHRSGYQRASIWRFLKRFSLDDEQAEVLREIVLRQMAEAGPEFVEMRRAACIINSAGLREGVRNLLLQSQKQYVIDRGKRLLSILKGQPM